MRKIDSRLVSVRSPKVVERKRNLIRNAFESFPDVGQRDTLAELKLSRFLFFKKIDAINTN